MTDLIAFISQEKATAAHVRQVIKGQEWEKIYLIANQDFNESLKKDNMELIRIDNRKMLPEIAEDIRKHLKDKVKMMETAVNIIAGSGKEHMALLSALLKLGVGIRFIAFTTKGVREI
ncbi:hypothetical protein GF323_06630 [Candidatus Woesearchaeota archaeon]|nr:hypothetical protein [Candidatus Woesearchaeota archaeon]